MDVFTRNWVRYGVKWTGTGRSSLILPAIKKAKVSRKRLWLMTRAFLPHGHQSRLPSKQQFFSCSDGQKQSRSRVRQFTVGLYSSSASLTSVL